LFDLSKELSGHEIWINPLRAWFKKGTERDKK